MNLIELLFAKEYNDILSYLSSTLVYRSKETCVISFHGGGGLSFGLKSMINLRYELLITGILCREYVVC